MLNNRRTRAQCSSRYLHDVGNWDYKNKVYGHAGIILENQQRRISYQRVSQQTFQSAAAFPQLFALPWERSLTEFGGGKQKVAGTVALCDGSAMVHTSRLGANLPKMGLGLLQAPSIDSFPFSIIGIPSQTSKLAVHMMDGLCSETRLPRSHESHEPRIVQLHPQSDTYLVIRSAGYIQLSYQYGCQRLVTYQFHDFSNRL